jgi:cellulose synthase/poly-beta-1,6-N-acetylglucosamine synthase-like glycosyltransferase
MKPIKISILIPCYNEELTIEKCIASCFLQSRPADEIIIVDDCSTDKTPEILKNFADKVKIVRTPQNTGNKSFAQEYGLSFVTGDFFITTDGDTILDKDFIKSIEKDMQKPSVVAIAGYIKSLRHNWLTACRGLDYAIGQNIDKLAQSYIDSIFVIPGAAGAFRTEIFRKVVKFDHDTITEDLDFTYRFHELGYKIVYNRRAICFTQDPFTLRSYICQMRRWFGGGWQNLMKHLKVHENPGMALEISLMYVEGIAYSFLMFALPIINLQMTVVLMGIYSIIVFIFSIFAAIKEKRVEFLFAFPAYLFLKYVNAWIFLEQFFKEVIFKKKNLVWAKPTRAKI